MSSIEEPVLVRASRKERKAGTRAALLAAGRRCFAAQGYRGTQVGDIARSAGVAHGTFYVHFPSKDELLVELLTSFNQGLVNRLRAVEAGSRMRGVVGLEPLVRRMAHAFLGYWLEHRDFVRAVAEKIAVGTSVDSLRDGIDREAASYLASLLQETSQAWSSAMPRVELFTQGLLAMWMRIGLQALFHRGVSTGEAEQALVTMTVGALRQAVAPTP